MKRSALICLVLGLFYPNILLGMNIKEVPIFCRSVLSSLGRGSLKPGEITKVARFETYFSLFPTVNYDPINLARGHPILGEKTFEGFLNLSMPSKIYLLTKYPEYLSINQLESVAASENFFKGVDEKLSVLIAMKDAINRQIELFKEAEAGATYFEESITRKYSRKFRPESSEIFKNGKASQVLNSSINTGHKLIYELVREQKTSTIGPQYNIINGQLEAFLSAGQNNPPEKILKLTSLIEISNSFFEFLVGGHRRDFSDMQFLNFVEGFQLQKRDLLEIVAPLNKSSFLTVSPEAESWNFYGELFKFSKVFNLNPFQKKILWNYIDPEIRTMARMSLRTDQIDWLEGMGKSKVILGLGYDEEREDRRYEDLKKKILAYGDSNSPFLL
jgi:hypothetical protein